MLKLPFHKLLIWQKSMRLAKEIYVLTKMFPKSEMYGFVSQMRRAAVSVPSNIAEGSQRGSNKEFLHFISIAQGSLAELETQCILSSDIGYTKSGELESIIIKIHEVARMITAFRKSLTTSH
jgi:four helix bundle protein